MREIKNELVEMLKAEVKPAVGCTEPVALALACAKAKELLGEDVVENKMLVSPSIYKNGMCVGIPGTKRLGLKIAAAIGIVGGKSEDGLTVLEGPTEQQIKQAEVMMDEGKLSIEPADTTEKVYIVVEFKGKNNSSKVIVKTKHDNFVYLEQNGKVLLNEELKSENANEQVIEEKLMDKATLAELVYNVEKMELEEIKFLLDGIKMNLEMADYGLSGKIGIGVGHGLEKSIKDGLLGDDVINTAMVLTAAASDARMSGVKMPVMSSSGSGNHGLTAILPIAAYAKKFPQSDEKIAKALAISHLTTAYIKNFTGRLSAMCGCGVAASTGASAGLTWLMGGNLEQIAGSIQNMIADLSGMICDGAKGGCALKLASAASAAVQNAIIANYGCFTEDMNGIVSVSVDETVRNLGKVSDKGMSITDVVILDVMNQMNKVK